MCKHVFEEGGPATHFSIETEALMEGRLGLYVWQEDNEEAPYTVSLAALVDDALEGWVNLWGPEKGHLDPKGAKEAEMIIRLLEAEAARIRLRWLR